METVVIASVQDAGGAQALLHDFAQRSGDDGFKLEAATVLYRDRGGRIAGSEAVTDAPVSATAAGTAIGAIVGLFSGPLALLLGGATGAVVGSLVDVSDAEDTEAIVDSVVRSVPPDSHAVIAVANEASPGPVDHLAANHGASVLRLPRAELELELAAGEEAVLAAREEARRVLRTRRRVAAEERIRTLLGELRHKVGRRHEATGE